MPQHTSGNCGAYANGALYSFGACQAPWGGRKESGYGRTHSKHGLYDLSQIPIPSNPAVA